MHSSAKVQELNGLEEGGDDNSSRDISPYKKSFRHSFIGDGRGSILVTGSTNMRLLPQSPSPY